MYEPTDKGQYLEKLPQMVSARHKVTPQTEKHHFHLHEQLEVVMVLSDNLGCRYEGGSCALPPWSVLLLNSMTLHYIFRRSPLGEADRYVVYFLPEYVEGLSTPELNLLTCFFLPMGPAPTVLPIPPAARPEALRLMEQLAAPPAPLPDVPSRDGAQVQAAATRLLLGQLLVFLHQLYLMQPGSRLPQANAHQLEAAFAVRAYIQRHYGEKILAAELARQAYLGRTQLYRVFYQVFGVTVGEYLTRYRMTRAKDLLLNSDYSIQLIAEKVGYNNASAFTRAFRARTGQSPAAFRHHPV